MNSTSKPEAKKTAPAVAKGAAATAEASPTVKPSAAVPATTTQGEQSVAVFVSRRVWPD